MSMTLKPFRDSFRFTIVSAYDDSIDWDKSAIGKDEYLLSDHSEATKLVFKIECEPTEFVCRMIPAGIFAELQAMLPLKNERLDRRRQVRLQIECFRQAVVEIRRAEGWDPELWTAEDGTIKQDAIDRSVIDQEVVQEIGFAAFMRQALSKQQAKN